MGTWGPGNFDNDTAADHLSILTHRLAEEVTTAVANPNEIGPDEYWGCAVPCNIAILNLIARQRYRRAKVPGVAAAEQCKRDYLSVWDECIDGLDPKPEYKRQRREVLVQTFDELIGHALWYEHDNNKGIARLNNPSDAFERDVLTQAFIDKTVALSRCGQYEEAIAIWDDIAARFESSSEPAAPKTVALALRWKAHLQAALAVALSRKARTLWDLGRIEEAIVIYEAVANRFGAAAETPLIHQAAVAIFDKAWMLKRAGRIDEAAAAYRDLIARFGAIDDGDLKCPAYRDLIARLSVVLDNGAIKRLVKRSRELLEALK
jgi:tetratricopeptide (TPR) repeat protein